MPSTPLLTTKPFSDLVITGFHKPGPAASLTSLHLLYITPAAWPTIYHVWYSSIRGNSWLITLTWTGPRLHWACSGVRPYWTHKDRKCVLIFPGCHSFALHACGVCMVPGGGHHRDIWTPLLSSEARPVSAQASQSAEIILSCWQAQDQDFDHSGPHEIVFKQTLISSGQVWPGSYFLLPRTVEWYWQGV